jgi:uncharacterized protein (DUF433 family)
MEKSLDRYIVVNPEIRGGRPHVVGTRIAVADVAVRYLRLGQPLEEMAGTFDLPLAALYAAMAYYYDHRAEIDQRLADDERVAADFRRAHAAAPPSLEPIHG